MVRRGTLRASDQDREHVAERLRQAAAEGRLLAEEFEHRLARALRARTYAELDPLVADLPRGAVVKAPARPVAVVTKVAAALVIAVAVVAVLAVVVAVITGFFFVWAFWAMLAWWFFGRGRRAGYRHGHRGQVRFQHRRTLL